MSSEGQTGEGEDRVPARKVVWSIIIVVCLITLGMAAMSAANYTEIVKAKTLTEVITVDTPDLVFDREGDLEHLNMTLEFNIFNPSKKELKVWVLTYKAWVRDTPLEDGVDNSRWRMVGRILVDGDYQSYFPVFSASFSFDDPSITVPPRSNITITRHLLLNRTNYPDIMEGLDSIREYSASMGEELEWMHYTSSRLFIQGVPPQAGPNLDANLIRRYDGVDITPGVGGAGA